MFDPLAVMLVVAFNQALILREKESAGNQKIKSESKDYLITNPKSWWKFWEMYNDEKPKVEEPIAIFSSNTEEVKPEEKERKLGKGAVAVENDI